MEVTAKMDPCRTGLEACERLREVPGIRAQTATALVAAERHGKAFEKGRNLADRLSLALRESSTGSKQRLEVTPELYAKRTGLPRRAGPDGVWRDAFG